MGIAWAVLLIGTVLALVGIIRVLWRGIARYRLGPPHGRLGIANGRIVLREGELPRGFAPTMVEFFRDHGIRQGTITVLPSRGRLAFQFSHHIPIHHHQALRNLCYTFGARAR